MVELDALMFVGREFHNIAADVSKSRLPCLMVMWRFGTSDVVDADRSALLGWYQLSMSHR